MRSKGLFLIIGIVFAGSLLLGTFIAGFFLGNSFSPLGEEPPSLEMVGEVTPIAPSTAAPSASDLGQQAETPEDLEKLFEPFWETWAIVHERYVDQPLDNTSLVQSAIRGMLDGLEDPHTSYLDPVQYNQFTTRYSEDYQGIGAWVDTSAEYLTIISTMPDSPAEKAGVRARDMVIAVDGEDVTGIDGDLVISRILGPAGTKVTLTILREGEPAPLEIEITRAKITIPTLDGEILEGDIAYVQLFQFGGASGDDLRETLAGLLEQNPEGLILDLRNNGGGLLTSAIQVTSEFISDGVLLYQEYGDGERDIHRAKRGGLATEIPLVVLINEGSASASEILAGAVQDYERGLLVGTTSFGKGTVQITLPLMNEQGAVKITIARWLTPNERQIGEIGIEPDFEVPITEEDLTEDRDPQLEKAIELLKDGP